MEKYLILAGLFLAIPIVRAIMHWRWLVRTRFLQKEHKEFLERVVSTDDDVRMSAWDKVVHNSEILELFDRASIQDTNYTRVKPLGYGAVQNVTYSASRNIFSDGRVAASWTTQAFYEAIGYYKKGIRQSLSIFYWIERLKKGPSELAISVGVEKGSPLIKVANIGFWSSALLVLIYFILTGDDVQ